MKNKINKIRSVKRIASGSFIINDSVVIHNIIEENGNILYDIKCDNIISDKDAEELANLFIEESIEESIKSHN